jgi:hypothetical protein
LGTVIAAERRAGGWVHGVLRFVPISAWVMPFKNHDGDCYGGNGDGGKVSWAWCGGLSSVKVAG